MYVIMQFVDSEWMKEEKNIVSIFTYKNAFENLQA